MSDSWADEIARELGLSSGDAAELTRSSTEQPESDSVSNSDSCSTPLFLAQHHFATAGPRRPSSTSNVTKISSPTLRERLAKLGGGNSNRHSTISNSSSKPSDTRSASDLTSIDDEALISIASISTVDSDYVRAHAVLSRTGSMPSDMNAPQSPKGSHLTMLAKSSIVNSSAPEMGSPNSLRKKLRENVPPLTETVRPDSAASNPGLAATADSRRESVSSPKPVGSMAPNSVKKAKRKLLGAGGPQVLYSGWLEKRGRHVKNWKTRYCILTPTAFQYFSGEDSMLPKGAFAISDITDFKRIPKAKFNKDHCFALITPMRSWYCVAPSEGAVEDWRQALAGVMLKNPAFSLPAQLGRRYTHTGRLLGEGGFSVVRLGEDTKTGEKVAVKVIAKAALDDDMFYRVQREVQMMEMLEHPHIVQLRESIYTTSHICIVMEYVSGVPLDEYLQSLPTCHATNTNARKLFTQLVESVAFCHQRGIAHRDLKMENVMICAGGEEIKLIDFGLGGFFGPDLPLKTHCGTYEYAAPEMIAQVEYDAPLCDAWSLGVILYAMLAGYLPFSGGLGADYSTQRLLDRVVQGYAAVYFPSFFRQTAISLIQKALCVDPNCRITAIQMQDHSWCLGSESSTPNTTPPPSAAPLSSSTPGPLMDFDIDLMGFGNRNSTLESDTTLKVDDSTESLPFAASSDAVARLHDGYLISSSPFINNVLNSPGIDEDADSTLLANRSPLRLVSEDGFPPDSPNIETKLSSSTDSLPTKPASSSSRRTSGMEFSMFQSDDFFESIKSQLSDI